MNAPNTFRTIKPEALKQAIAGHDPIILIDTLTEDHFKLTHLPGARNACVFRVDFLQQISYLLVGVLVVGIPDVSPGAKQRVGFIKEEDPVFILCLLEEK